MVALEEQYIGGGWIPPFLGESTKAASEEPATAPRVITTCVAYLTQYWTGSQEATYRWIVNLKLFTCVVHVALLHLLLYYFYSRSTEKGEGESSQEKVQISQERKPAAEEIVKVTKA